MNRVILIGRATKDFELRYTPGGTAVANCTIAVDAGKDEQADFINVVAWKQTAEAAANYVRKGHRFGLEGRVKVRNYEKDGRKVYVTEVHIDRLEFLEPREQKQSGGRSSDPFADSGKPIDITDDDLPF